MGSAQLSQVMTSVSKYASFNRMILCCSFVVRDPTQHGSLKAEIEDQSTALYSTARLWDDGVIKPTDTRDVLGLALGVVSREPGSRTSTTSTWDGDKKGYGIFRM